MQLLVEKSARRLTVWENNQLIFSCRIALGREPQGPKQQQGDGRTPEGSYFICLIKQPGKYGRSLGLSYPNTADAAQALENGLIDQRTHDNIAAAIREGRRPPWGSPLGGEIYIHEGGSHADWTQGCIALDEQDMDVLFPLHEKIDIVEIRP